MSKISLDEQIRNLVEENLPGMQAKAFKKFVEDAEENLEVIEALSSDLKSANDRIKALQNTNADYGSRVEKLLSKIARLKNKYGDLNEREKELNKRELQLDKTLLETQLSESEKRAEAVYSLVDKVFRNPIYKESYKHNVVNESPNLVSDYDANGRYVQRQVGVNKYTQPVEDTKESTLE